MLSTFQSNLLTNGKPLLNLMDFILIYYFNNYCISNILGNLRHTDQPKKKALFPRFAAVHPLREIFFFAEKNKNHLFRRGFSPRNFTEKLRKTSRRNSATFRGDTPRDFAEKLREISRWVGKDLRFFRAGSEDSDQTEKLSECPA